MRLQRLAAVPTYRVLAAIIAVPFVALAVSGCASGAKHLDVGAADELSFKVFELSQDYKLGQLGGSFGLGEGTSEADTRKTARSLRKWQSRYGGLDADADSLVSHAIAFADAYADAIQARGSQDARDEADYQLEELNGSIERWNQNALGSVSR